MKRARVAEQLARAIHNAGAKALRYEISLDDYREGTAALWEEVSRMGLRYEVGQILRRLALSDTESAR